MKIHEIFFLIFGAFGMPFIYFACFTKTGSSLMWELMRFNSVQKNLYADEKDFRSTLKLVGTIMAMFYFVGAFVLVYRFIFGISIN